MKKSILLRLALIPGAVLVLALFLLWQARIDSRNAIPQVTREEVNDLAGDLTVSDSGEVYTLNPGGHSEETIKYYKVSDRDDTFLRSLLAYDVWNEIADTAALQRGAEPVVLTEDGALLGLFLKSSSVAGEKVRVEEGTLAGAVSPDPEYLLFLQACSAWKNISDCFKAIRTGTGDSCVLVPTRVEYAFGICPGHLSYMNFRYGERILSLSELGVTEESGQQELFAAMAGRWAKLRSGALSDEKLGETIDAYADVIAASGYPEESGQYAGDDDFSAEDYYRNSCAMLKEEITARMQVLDTYYGFGTYQEASAYESGLMQADLRSPGFEETPLQVSGLDETIYPFAKDEATWAFLPEFAEKGEDGDSAGGASAMQTLYSDADMTLCITTANGTLEYLTADHDHKEPGEIAVYDGSGSLILEHSLSKIKCKGHTSFNHSDKKSFRICFEEQVNLAEGLSGDEFVLVSNNFDESKMRNAAALTEAGALGIEGCPNFMFTDVYFNGEYTGNYLLVRSVQNPGRYLFEVSAEEERSNPDHVYFTDQAGARYELDEIAGDPEPDQAAQELAADEITALLDRVYAAESFDELLETADVNSLAAMYLMDRLFDDPDANFFSTFYYVGDDGKLHAGPVWDYDLSLSNHSDSEMDTRVDRDPENSFQNGIPELLVKKFPEMQQLAQQLWLQRGKDQAQLLSGDLTDSWSAENEASFAMDRVRWEGTEGYAGASGQEDALREMQQALRVRMELMPE